jgi:predicted DNA-binding transcriptional regulator AlpA
MLELKNHVDAPPPDSRPAVWEAKNAPARPRLRKLTGAGEHGRVEKAHFWLEILDNMAEPNQQLAEPLVHRANPPVHTEALLSIPQAAAYLGMSSKWLYRNYASLPHIRIGAGNRPRIKFRQCDLDAWVSEHRIAPGSR